MKTTEEYLKILTETNNNIEKLFPNWRMIQEDNKFASMFARCLPSNMTYEDIVIVSFMFNKVINKGATV